MITGCSAPAEYNGAILKPPAIDTLKVVWRTEKSFDRGVFSNSNLRPEIVQDSLVVFGSGEGFVCLNRSTGAIKWASNLGIGLRASNSWFAMDILVENGRLYTIAGNDAIRGSIASVVCLSVSDGHLIWRHDLSQNESFAWYWSKYASSATSLFYSTQSGHVVAISKSDGSLLWDSPNGSVKPLSFGIYQGSPIYRNGVVYVGSGFSTPDRKSNDGGVTALDAQSGQVLWGKVIPKADSSSDYPSPELLNDYRVATPPLPTEDGIIITAGFCLALMDTSGRIVWMKAPSVTGGISVYTWQPFLSRGKLIGYNNGNGHFFAFSADPHTGSIYWVHNASDFSATANFFTPVIDSNVIALVSDDVEGSLWIQSIEDGSLKSLTPLSMYLTSGDADVTGQFVLHGGYIYFQTLNEIICLQRKR